MGGAANKSAGLRNVKSGWLEKGSGILKTESGLTCTRGGHFARNMVYPLQNTNPYTTSNVESAQYAGWRSRKADFSPLITDMNAVLENLAAGNVFAAFYATSVIRGLAA